MAAGLPDLPISVANARLSASAPTTAPLWPPGLGEGGALALPNQGILPEDSRPSRGIPEVLANPGPAAITAVSTVNPQRPGSTSVCLCIDPHYISTVH